MVSACEKSSSGECISVGNSSPGRAQPSSACIWCRHVPNEASSCPHDSTSLKEGLELQALLNHEGPVPVAYRRRQTFYHQTFYIDYSRLVEQDNATWLQDANVCHYVMQRAQGLRKLPALGMILWYSSFEVILTKTVLGLGLRISLGEQWAMLVIIIDTIKVKACFTPHKLCMRDWTA